MSHEINFDGLVGPTHNYAGLSFGNIASKSHQKLESNPREAALQGLQKMKFLHDRGLRQAVLPPQERPSLETLRALGFTGSEKEVLASVQNLEPELLSVVSSASSMWTANAGTLSPSTDSTDGRVHFTPANLAAKLHRSIEATTTGRVFQAIFRDPRYFTHHPALPCSTALGDEGAANHTRLCANYGSPGVHLFIYGKKAYGDGSLEPRKFPARQTLEASRAVARLHRLPETATVFAQQSPEAIDAGVFHNDVASVGNQNVFFHHEKAFLNLSALSEELKKKFSAVATGGELKFVQVPTSKVSLEDAVKSYLFNSQLVSMPGTYGSSGKMSLIAPIECQETASVKRYLDELLADQNQTSIGEVHYLDLRQSMRNGGGPACLRFRAVLSDEEIAGSVPGVFLDDQNYEVLCEWVRRNYRDRLQPNDLADPRLVDEGRKALDELTGILGLGSVYPFQLGHPA